MITEEYVSFETAKLLKEKGFEDDFSYGFYTEKGEIKFLQTFGDCAEYDENTCIEAPTQALAMRWLREIHNLYISIEPNHDKEGLHNAYVRRNWWEHNWAGIGYKSYEDACEVAIKYCLENLI